MDSPLHCLPRSQWIITPSTQLLRNSSLIFYSISKTNPATATPLYLVFTCWTLWYHKMSRHHLITNLIVSFDIVYDKLTFSKQLLTEGSMLLPPKDAISPRCFGSCRQSWSNKPSLRWSTKPLESATRRKISGTQIMMCSKSVKHCILPHTHTDSQTSKPESNVQTS